MPMTQGNTDTHTEKRTDEEMGNARAMPSFEDIFFKTGRMYTRLTINGQPCAVAFRQQIMSKTVKRCNACS